MGFCGAIGRIIFLRILPVVVLLVALLIGWFASTDVPEGTMFATVYPIAGGNLPGTVFGNWSTPGTAAVPATMTPGPRPGKEIFLELPSGAKMPANGLGMCCRPNAYDPESVYRQVLWYLLQGGRHIDTAQLYLNHRPIGVAIREAIARGVPRAEIFVTTKVINKYYGEKETAASITLFLDELGLEYLDLVLLHQPKPIFPFFPGPPATSGATHREQRESAWKGLAAAHKKGLVKDIGVSNFNKRQLAEIAGLSLAPVAVNQFQFNPWVPEHLQETFTYCKEKSIVVTAFSSFQGTFMQKAQAFTVQLLNDVAQSHGKTPAQILLRWALQKGASVIPGTGNPKHMKENLEVYSFELSAADMKALDSLASDEAAKAFMSFPPDES